MILKEVFIQMCLCGLLPCISAKEGAAAESYMIALQNEGFPCMEVDFTDAAGEIERLTRVLLASSTGIAVGARVKTSAQAELALGAGAAWVALSPDERALLTKETSTQVCVVREEWAAKDGTPEEWASALERKWAQSLGFSLAHIGINGDGEQDAATIAKAFARLLGVAYAQQETADFAGDLVEVMRENERGIRGHIGFGVNDLERGMYYAQRKGFAFDPASRKNNASGQPILYYLDQDIGGFAVHLLQMERKNP